MALTCNPDELAALARCLKCLSGPTLLQAQVWLLCQFLSTLGMPDCEPNALAAASKGFAGYPLQEMQTYLLARLAGGSLDPNVLAQAAKDYQKLSPATLQEVNTRLLCLLAGGS